jgi:two-component sensor histidine kinase
MVGFAMLLIGVVFPFDGGSQSPLAFVFISLVHVFIIISNNRTQTVVFFLMLFTMTSLYGFEYYQPELINNNYPDPQTRLLDFIFTMGYSLFFILMTTLVFKKSYNRERKRVVNQNEELTQLNRKMVEKTKQIETLMKELSHRVKNNLQVVTSLLNLQSNRIKDPEAKAALLDGRNRLISMILLHQKLYITDKPTVVEMKEYIHDLAYVLLESNRPDRELLVLNLDEISLKIESAVPLGLILNELITNSLKYAFINESSSDRIEISFLRHEKNLVLTVKDNGVGFTRKNNSSFGLQLVDSLTAQLEATCEMISASGMTTIITLTQND